MRRALIAIVALAASLGGASSAQAAMNITSFNATPSTTLAAAHPNFTTSIRLSYSNTTDDVRAVQTFLPPGLVGNPRNVGSCTLAQLNADTCPAGSKIGTTSSIARAPDNLPLPPTTSTGDVYNVTPTGSEPARIGMVVRPLGGLLGKFALSGAAAVRIPGDFGLTVTFNDLPRTLPALGGGLPIPVQILGLDLTLNGVVGGKAFMTNPTSCIPAGTGLAATSYQGGGNVSTSFSSYTPTDCGNVPFDPQVAYWFSETRANTNTALIAGVFVPGTEFPRAQSHIKNSVTVLPIGTQINFAALPNIGQCTDAQLNTASAAPTTCPANSKIGQTAIVSPVVGTVTGDIFFAAPAPGTPLRLFMTARITPTQTAKFIIVNHLIAGGGIQADLTNLPQVSQTQFVLGFNSGPNSLLKTPLTCGTKYGLGLFTPWSGGPQKFNFARMTITRNQNGTPCAAAAVAKTAKPALANLVD